MCSICLEDTSDYSLPCGHAFHSSCLFECAIRGILSCPNCRDPFLKEEEEEEWQDDAHEMPIVREGDDHARIWNRSIQKARRLIRNGKASLNLRHAVGQYDSAVSAKKKAQVEHKEVCRQASSVCKPIRNEVRKKLRGVPPEVRRHIVSHVYTLHVQLRTPIHDVCIRDCKSNIVRLVEEH